MKYSLFVIALIFSLILVFATPVLKLQNTNPQPKETVIGTIHTEGKLLEELKKEDITFYEGRKQVYFDYDLHLYGDTYYLYIVFNKEGNFTIKTKELLYNLAGEVGSTQIEKTITVKYNGLDNETQIPANLLEIKPSMIFTLLNQSKITFFNRGSNDLILSVSNISVNVQAYQAKTINLNLVEPFTYLDVSTYKTFRIPIIYLKGQIPTNTTPSTNTTSNETIILKSMLGITPSELEINVSENETIKRVIYLENSGENNITSIQLKTQITQAKIESPYSINPGSTGNITIQMFAGQISRNETINLTYIENEEEFNYTIPINIIIIKKNQSTEPIEEQASCEDYGGMICEEDCQGESNFTYDGYCCYDECVPFNTVTPEPTESDSSIAWIIGLLIFIIIAAIGYTVYKKYYKTKPEEPDTKIEVSKKHYEDRLKGAITRH